MLHGTLYEGGADAMVIASALGVKRRYYDAFALNANSKDAALVVQLSPGSYTVQVSGVASGVGTVLVEIYDADR